MATFIKATGCTGCPGCDDDPCDPEPSAPSPTLVCDSISASITKCGFEEFGTPSSPPKIYRTKTQTGGLWDYINTGTADEERYQNTFSGSLEYARSSCSTTDTRQLDILYVSGSNNSNCTATKTVTGANSRVDTDLGSGVFVGTQLWGTNCAGTTADQLQGCDSEVVVSTTVKTYATTSCSPAFTGGTVSGNTVTLTLSNEYTTAHLIADVEAALPSYPGTWAGTCSSLRDLDSDELTYTIRRFKYKFELPDLTGYSCYKITWLEGATAREYIWNGTDTETPEYGPISEPGTNGTIGISSVVATCECA